LSKVARLLPSLQRHPVLVLAFAVLLEALNGLLFSSHVVPDVTDANARGTPPAIALAIAVLAALITGPVVGGIAAAAGWGFFFGLVLPRWNTIFALPVWVGVTIVAGIVSRRLREVERAYLAMHRVRTPIASAVGLLRSVREQDVTAHALPILAAAESNAEQALDEFDRAADA
jgi:hypothetical protein